MTEDAYPLDDLEENQISNKVEFFATEDDKLKFLGEILSNDSSRQILILLINQEMSADEISKKTNLRLSLVIHHLNKMQKAGIVLIDKIGKNTKNRDVKYYHAKSGILILPKDASERAIKSKTFHHSIKRVLRFATIGFAGLATWVLTRPSETSKYDLAEPDTVPDTGVVPIEPNESGLLLSIIISLAVITVGLVSERVFLYIENNRKI